MFTIMGMCFGCIVMSVVTPSNSGYAFIKWQVLYKAITAFGPPKANVNDMKMHLCGQ